MKLAKYIAVVVITIVAVIAVYCLFAPKGNDIEVSKGKIKNVESLVQLCTVDFYNEVPVKDTVNFKMLFGIQKQQGSISFDIDRLEIDAEGDTVRIILPPEIIEIMESTEKDSWQVVDTKGLTILTRDKLTDEEENMIKSHIRQKSIRRLYQNGTVRRARAEAVRNLTSLMEKIYRKPVVVTDPTPSGAHATRQ